MQENVVPVRFYKGYISKEKITLKKDDKDIKMSRVKMPNDDPESSQVRRSFLVRESMIGTDTKNPNIKFVYLNKLDKDGNEIQYRVVRKNFDPNTKKSEIVEDTKMTAQQIADVFQVARDREYAEYKAAQSQNAAEVEAVELSEPEQVIENEDGFEI